MERVLHVFATLGGCYEHWERCVNFLVDIGEYNNAELNQAEMKIKWKDDVVYIRCIYDKESAWKVSGMDFTSIHYHDAVPEDAFRFLQVRLRSPNTPEELGVHPEAVTMNLQGLHIDGEKVIPIERYWDQDEDLQAILAEQKELLDKYWNRND